MPPPRSIFFTTWIRYFSKSNYLTFNDFIFLWPTRKKCTYRRVAFGQKKRRNKQMIPPTRTTLKFFFHRVHLTFLAIGRAIVVTDECSFGQTLQNVLNECGCDKNSIVRYLSRLCTIIVYIYVVIVSLPQLYESDDTRAQPTLTYNRPLNTHLSNRNLPSLSREKKYTI